MLDAIARAAEVDGATVRRAAMRSGDLGATARARARRRRRRAGRGAVRGAATGAADARGQLTTSVEAALAATGVASVEWKLDGARVQVHRSGSEVRIFTRNLNDVTERLPEVVDVVLGLPATELVLDGEAIGVADDDRPHRFQDTMSRFGTAETEALPGGTALRAFFFDCLRADGVDLLDAPLSDATRACSNGSRRVV